MPMMPTMEAMRRNTNSGLNRCDSRPEPVSANTATDAANSSAMISALMSIAPVVRLFPSIDKPPKGAGGAARPDYRLYQSFTNSL